MNAVKSILLSVLKSVISERLLKRVIIYALEKYADANDNDLTKDVVDGVKQALEPKSE